MFHKNTRSPSTNHQITPLEDVNILESTSDNLSQQFGASYIIQGILIFNTKTEGDRKDLKNQNAALGKL